MEVLLDTHAWAWMLADDPKFSDGARQALSEAETVRLSPITFFEIGQKVRVGKWPSMAPHLDDLPRIMADQGILSAAFTPEVALAASSLVWDHRDPFDRILAATAMSAGYALLSADVMFDTLKDPHLNRVW